MAGVRQRGAQGLQNLAWVVRGGFSLEGCTSRQGRVKKGILGMNISHRECGGITAAEPECQEEGRGGGS